MSSGLTENEDSTRRAHYHNRLRWDETVAAHCRSDLYRVPRVIDGHARLSSLESAALGRHPDAVCMHVMCHIGTDTILAAPLFRAMIGVDYSSPAVSAGARTATAAGARNVAFAVGDIRALPVRSRTVDVAFLNWGSLIWLLDLPAAVAELARTLRPGGRLVIVDQHPVARGHRRGTPAHTGPVAGDAYFGPGTVELTRGDYADRANSFRNSRVTEARHSLSDLIGALSAHFVIRRFSEHSVLGWPAYRGMTRVEDRLWQFADTPIPLSLVIDAQLP